MRRWHWTTVLYKGASLEVCIECNAARYTGNDICALHSEEVLNPLLTTGAQLKIYKIAIEQIKGEQNDRREKA